MGWSNVTADALITTHPALFHGVTLLTSAAAGDVTVYEGQDAVSGRKIGTFKAAANISWSVRFQPPLKCDRGIYIDVGSNVTEAIVHWSPQE
jgi:hypothetical protein